jgi:hypothetical protein
VSFAAKSEIFLDRTSPTVRDDQVKLVIPRHGQAMAESILFLRLHRRLPLHKLDVPVA